MGFSTFRTIDNNKRQRYNENNRLLSNDARTKPQNQRIEHEKEMQRDRERERQQKQKKKNKNKNTQISYVRHFSICKCVHLNIDHVYAML